VPALDWIGESAVERVIGELWEELSGGRCRFLMVKDRRWDWNEEKLR